MGSTYSIRLCRPWRFRFISAIVFLCVLACFYFFLFGKGRAFLLAGLLLLRADAAGGTNILMAVFCGIGILLLALFGIFLLFLSGAGLFFNRIFVRENAVWVFFAPRMFFRVWKPDIHKIEKVTPEEVSNTERLKSLNFAKENVYRFVCYDTSFLVTTKDEDAMRTLMLDINPRNNPRECDEPDYDPTKLTWGEWFLLDILEEILRFIFG